MEIGKIALSFVILGLASCGADRCDDAQLKEAMRSCAVSTASSVRTAGNDVEKICSDLKTLKSCLTGTTNGCNGAVVARLSQELDQEFKHLESECPGLGKSHASSTSVVNIALLIAGTAAFVPFL